MSGRAAAMVGVAPMSNAHGVENQCKFYRSVGKAEPSSACIPELITVGHSAILLPTLADEPPSQPRALLDRLPKTHT
jgi:hypothetical protein